eukprot:scaffold202780_cov32-Tisochrysis_lutea.AAC.3
MLSEQASRESRACMRLTYAASDPCAMQVLWPLFHYIPLSMLDADIDMIHKRWQGYTTLNRHFAAVVLDIASGVDDLVWIHDYYLTLLPQARGGPPSSRLRGAQFPGR